MIISGISFDLVGVSPKTDLGITWASVAGVMHPVDYGEDTTHISSQVTASGSYVTMGMLRNAIESLNGQLTGFTLSPGEYPWGLAYDYSVNKVSNYGCYVFAPGAVTNVNGVQSTLTFTMAPIDSYSTEVLSYSAWPTDKLYIETFSNNKDRATSIYDTMKGQGVAAFDWEAPSCSVTYVMSRTYAARLIAYFTKLRSGYLTLAHAADVFGDGSLSHEVYCTSFSQAPVDKAGNYWRIVANYSQRIT